ncbi:hypothetical protein Pcinc_043432 [Petrolisthes cinctipes]|uniref:Uncharacterized protein n=1 Tax=Petrolisthes cinctipes TaxID=88211 RepID=A0AAE1EF47_PETCI|nr:hypothetical protein Pcinc_043432 [Petrolisthes cinctipes]
MRELEQTIECPWEVTTSLSHLTSPHRRHICTSPSVYLYLTSPHPRYTCTSPHLTLGIPVPHLTLGIPVPHLTHGIPVPHLTHGIPVPHFTHGIPVPHLTLGIPVPHLTLGIPVPHLTLGLPLPHFTLGCLYITSNLVYTIVVELSVPLFILHNVHPEVKVSRQGWPLTTPTPGNNDGVGDFSPFLPATPLTGETKRG